MDKRGRPAGLVSSRSTRCRCPESGRDGIRFSIIINVDAPSDVDEMIALFREAGGSVSKDPTDAEFFDGRSAYASDPEGNYWEIAWVAPGNSVVAAAPRGGFGVGFQSAV